MSAASVAAVGLLAAVVGAAVLFVRRQPRPLARRLAVVLVAALSVRLVAAMAIELTLPWQLTRRGAMTPDEAVVDYAARLLASGDERSPVVLGGSLHTLWLLLASGLYGVWDAFLALRLTNVLLGTLLVLPAFVLGRDLGDEGTGVGAAWAVALFPNAVVWSVLGLREPLVALLLLLVLALALRAVRVGPAPARALLLAVVAGTALVGLGFSRSYMVPLLMALILGTAVVASVLGRSLRPLATAGVVSLVALAVTFAVPRGPELVDVTLNLASEQSATVYNPFSDCSDESRCQATEAEAARGALPSSAVPKADAPPPPAPLTESLQSVSAKGPVRAFAIAVLAGRPVWETREYFFLLQPGVVVWWTVLPLVAFGLGLLAVRRDVPAVLLSSGYIGAVIVFLAFSGQFIRHHFMIEPLALVLATLAVRALPSSPTWGRRGVLAACAAMAAAATASVLQSLA